MAILGIQPSNLLLLDEPTNHLDIPAREAIEAFLRETPATLLVVSHDRRLLETVCDRLWVVGEGQATPFDGGYGRGGRPSRPAGR
jgi:ATP-binding cassette subfamily F protein 3